MSLFQFSRSGSNFESATPQKSERRCDFITFLAVAQNLGFKFLPISWDRRLDAIGNGGTAEILESIVSKTFSFAFKRPARYLDFDSDEVESHYLPMLIDEISVLGNPQIRKHPNIIQIEAICWEVITEQGNRFSRQNSIEFNMRHQGVMPVLVFQKSELGDLHHFMTQGKGKKLDFWARIKICIEVARGVTEMHSQNIIHGDIKPRNVLVFANDTENFIPKVADFGFSTRWVRANDLILMPRSQPWSAPEWHHRGFSPAQAVLMDTYSFGMLVLWLIWPLNCIHQERSARYFEIGCQKDLDPASLVHPLVEYILQTQNMNLGPIFDATLSNNAAIRCPDFGHLQRLLDPKNDVQCSLGDPTRDISILDVDSTVKAMGSSNPTDIKISPYKEDFANKDSWKTADFQVIPAMIQLYDADYRVRIYVARCLLRKLAILEKNYSTRLSFRNTVLQCAICYEVGFGIERDSKRSREILEKCGHDARRAFYRELESLKQERYTWTPAAKVETAHNQELEFATNKKFDFGESPFDFAHGQTELDYAFEELRKEITDAENWLGFHHSLVKGLKSNLSLRLAEAERLEEAEVLKAQVEETQWMALPCERSKALAIRDNLAIFTLILRKIRSRENDDSFWSQLVSLSPENFGHDASIIAFNASCSLLAGSPQLKTKLEEFLALRGNRETTERPRSEELNAQNLERASHIISCLRAAIRNHRENGYPEEQRELKTLVTSLMMRKDWIGAEAVQMEIVRQNVEFLGRDSLVTLESMFRLAVIFSDSGQLYKSKALFEYLLELSEEMLGTEHSETLNTLFALASVYEKQHEHMNSLKLVAGKRRPSMTAEMISHRVTELSEKTLGPNHQFSMRCKNSWAMMLCDQNRFEEAEMLLADLLERSGLVLGERHEKTLDIALVLAVTIRKQGRWKEAKELIFKAFESESFLYRSIWQLGIYLTFI